MIKELVSLQRNSKSTCVIVDGEEFKKLPNVVSMPASVSDKFLFTNNIPPFAEKIDAKCNKHNLCHFVIKNIDEVSIQEQERFVGLVKDREFNGYNLPQNCIIVFTVKDLVSLKKLSPILFNLSVVAF